MSRYAKTGGCTTSTTESTMLDVCALQFPNGAVGAFKLLLADGIARLLVAEGGSLHAVSEMPVDPDRSAKQTAIGLLVGAAAASAYKFNHFDLLMRCELLQEGLIDADAFRSLAAWIAMRGIIQRAMDGVT